ncbi:DnaJ C-terminal domain-containing protein [Lewinella cohaerens]|uniref:DnaJ C-terminal domain-containing protein n=1 Tax=Lewinella cohaerens TaxID=70995 RepID=UPI00037AAF24|nr:J domain-containing protein [Lewinella cohaerens]
MAAFIDYYQILGISKDADEKAIKKAYRKLARKYHPDLNPGDQEAEKKFKEVNEANEVLGNAENRKKYDKYGKDWEHADEIEKQRRAQQQYQSSSRGHRSNGGGNADFSDFFESMFGGQSFTGGADNFGRRSPRFRGQDFRASLGLKLSDVYQTQKQTVMVNGKNLRFTIPAGIKDQQEIKIKGQGGSGANGGPAGDLYIRFDIVNDTPFHREGDDLYLEVPLDLYTALLGGEITIDTMDGKVRLKVKPETDNGAKVKLKGKGFPVYKKEGSFGDLYLTYQVVLPKNLSEEDKELFRQLAKGTAQ